MKPLAKQFTPPALALVKLISSMLCLIIILTLNSTIKLNHDILHTAILSFKAGNIPILHPWMW